MAVSAERMMEDLRSKNWESFIEKVKSNGHWVAFEEELRATNSVHLAVHGCDESLIRILVDGMGASVDQLCTEGKSCLHEAALYSTAEIVKLLIDRGADASVEDRNGARPLHYAACQNTTGKVSVLVAAGADPNQPNCYGERPLHCSAFRGTSEVMKELIECGAAPCTSDDEGWTPLHFCCQEGHSRCASLLLEKYSDPDAAEKEGWTPLHCAAQGGHDQCLAHLLSHGASVSSRNSSLSTALHVAAKYDHHGCVQLLLAHDASVKARTRNGNTPLHLAAKRRSASSVKLLLQHGSDPLAANNSHFTPLDLAVVSSSRNRTDECVEILSQATERKRSLKRRSSGLGEGQGRKRIKAACQEDGNRSLVALERRTECRDSESKLPAVCVVCFAKERQAVFLECGHFCTCVPCSRRLKSCPLCRRPIFRSVRVYE